MAAFSSDEEASAREIKTPRFYYFGCIKYKIKLKCLIPTK